MDVENLAKELILKNMTPEQQMAVLDSVRESVAQAKEVQKRKIGENVDLVVQALKKIESDIRDRFDSVGNAIEKRVASIQDGRDGINGKDGRDGKDGKSGRDGAKGDKGDSGRDGRDGVDGIDGVSVTNARIDFDGSLVITLSSGVELNVGEVVAPDLAESIKVITNGGGTSQSVLDTLASLQTQINTLIPSQTGNSGKYLTTNGTTTSWATVSGSGLSYQGSWNASTNSPTLTSSSGTSGYYYIVSVAGSTDLNGITDWKVGDWAIYNGTSWQKIDQSETLQTITSTDGSVTVTTTGSTADLSVAVAASTTNVICQVRNTTGSTLTKGTAVYISGATGQIPTVSKALATSDSTSAQTLGLMTADLANNTNGYVTVIGLISNMDTSAYTDGAQLYLSGTTAGTLTATKTYAPTHLVYVAVVEHAHPTQGKLFVKVQNGYELDEIHNVSAQSPSNGQTIIYNATTSLWEKANLTAGTGISVSNGAGSITVSNSGVTSAVAGTGISVSGATGAVTISNTGVTSVTGTSPVTSSGGTTPAISLASGYGDTQNPYASKTANYVLAAPNGSAGVPTFRAIVAADIPTLNQNTTGTASNVTGTVAIANGGTGQTTATAAFNALSPVTTTGDLIIGNGSNSSTRLAIGTNGYVLTSNGTTATWSAVSSSGVSSFSAGSTGLTPSTGTTGAVTLAGTLAVANGGTGLNGTPANGEIIIGNGSGFTKTTLTAGAGISVTNGAGSITIANTLVYSASYLVVGGGGGGAGTGAGGYGAGGAGGLLSGTTTLTIGTTYTVTVGAGGAAGSGSGSNGSAGVDSKFGTLTSAVGGGFGGAAGKTAGNGGSGGGAGAGQSAGSGTSGQGYAGATGFTDSATYGVGGGGGGSSAAGVAATSSGGGAGGAGTASSITGSSVTYAGGGGGGGDPRASKPAGAGGTGGGGAGGYNTTGTAGTANTGGGGGGAGASGSGTGGAGGSGVVIISVPSANYSGTTTGSPTVTTSGSNTILKFTASGSYTA